MNNLKYFIKIITYRFSPFPKLIIASLLLIILPGCEKDLFSPAGTVTDIDGKIYEVIKIGTQTWFAENLKTTKYNDGGAIPYVNDGFLWTYLKTDAFSYCNDSDTNQYTYGNLYNCDSREIMSDWLACTIFCWLGVLKAILG
jgi:hypothetical protein